MNQSRLPYLVSKSWRSGGLGSRLARPLSTTSHSPHWRNETPSGGLTEIYVYTQDSRTRWPDPALGVFANADPNFCLPGNTGLSQEATTTESLQKQDAPTGPGQASQPIDILETKTIREHQAQTLNSAHDYIHYTTGAENYVCSNPTILEVFPTDFAAMEKLKLELHEAPQLLRKELEAMFPESINNTNTNNRLNVITMSQKTENDMSTWSDAVEDERDKLSSQFVTLAKEICTR